MPNLKKEKKLFEGQYFTSFSVPLILNFRIESSYLKMLYYLNQKQNVNYLLNKNKKTLHYVKNGFK